MDWPIKTKARSWMKACPRPLTRRYAITSRAPKYLPHFSEPRALFIPFYAVFFAPRLFTRVIPPFFISQSFRHVLPHSLHGNFKALPSNRGRDERCVQITKGAKNSPPDMGMKQMGSSPVIVYEKGATRKSPDGSYSCSILYYSPAVPRCARRIFILRDWEQNAL